MRHAKTFGLMSLFVLGLSAAAWAQVAPSAFVNYEIAPIHAMAMSPDSNYLAAVNTPDMRVEIFSLTQGIPTPHASISVGMEPTSVRFRTNGELWVVNNLSDSVSIIDVAQKRLIATLRTLNDPFDVVFAGSPQRAFVSCGLARSLQVFDPANLAVAPAAVLLQGNNPRALAVSPDGSRVHVAFFHSGNRTTSLSGGTSDPGSAILDYPPDIVSRIGAGPHGGVNPPKNAGSDFVPPQNLAAGTPPKVSLIVRQDAQGAWRDDTGADWTLFVSGANGDYSGRYAGWTLLDNDLAVVNANTLQVGYVSDLMNLCMAIDVNPASGQVTVVGTEARNEKRFEPNISAKFIDVVAANANPVSLLPLGRTDLNSSLVAQFTGTQLSPALRATAIGDPRSVKWKSDGSVAYVAGMGSNNIVPINSSGQRVGPVIPVQAGPVGLTLDEARDQLYVQNRFDGSISVIDLGLGAQTALVTYFDPTPTVIRTGRKHLYDTQHSSGIGQISCGSCHIDGRMDRLSWDLGDPSGDKVLLSSRDLNRNDSFVIPLGLGITQKIGTGNLTDFHPMKGPMLTQTLQDIIDKEPLHWRGDRFGIEEFNGAFPGLQGRATELTIVEMAEFKAFLATINFPPNPFRNIDNTLPTNLNLSGHFATGRFTLAAGAPLPNGNAVTGLTQYRNKNIGSRLDQQAFACVTCHTLPTGGSTDRRWASNAWQTIPRGSSNENHLLVMGVSDIPSPIQNTVKVPHLRNVHERVGFHMRPGTPSLHGFGYVHDGNVASIADFIGNPAFNFASDQQIANMVALILSWSGSDFRETNGSLIVNPGNVALEPPGVFSKDSHAGVGQQETITSPSQSLTRLNQLVSADSGSTRVELIAKSYGPSGNRGYMLSGGNFLADKPSEQKTQAQLVAATGNGNSVTFTIVPAGTGQRLGRDRDMDNYLDYEELLNCTDPNDPASFGSGQCAEVVGSYAYHGGWTGSANPQWDAQDTGKVLAQPAASPTLLTMSNLINTSHGINGLAFDIIGLDNVNEATWQFNWSPPEAFDVNTNPVSSWAAAPAAAVTMHAGQGAGGADRFLLQWPNNQIFNRWLCIKLTIGPYTKTYYIGHLLGETTGVDSGMFSVSFASDIVPIRAALATNVNSSSTADIDKNGAIRITDIIAMRNNVGKQLPQITIPAVP